jgi:hypothetical protein
MIKKKATGSDTKLSQQPTKLNQHNNSTISQVSAAHHNQSFIGNR